MRFPPGCEIPDEERPEIDWLLHGIDEGEGDGRLRGPVHGVEVVRQISGGLSGAQVLEIKVLCGSPGSEVWYVVKLQDAETARTEWQAYRDHMSELKAAYLTEIAAVSQSLLEPGGPPAGERAAVVYVHVSERMGEPGFPVVTLEQLAQSAMEGSEEAARRAVLLVDRLVRRLRGTLSRAARPHPTSGRLQRLNPRLGADLVVELDEDAQPGDAVRHVYPADLFAASCSAGTGDGDPRFAVGSWISVPVQKGRLKSGVLTVHPSDDTRIEVRPTARATRQLKVSDVRADGTCTVQGPLRARVVSTRVLGYWSLVRELLGDDAVPETHGLRFGEHLVGHPFARLRSIICGVTEGWVTATVHDDLNPRNVLTADDRYTPRKVLQADDQPYLIDHARVDEDLPLLGDPAWLEINLLRNVVAPALSPPELIRLNRCLAVASLHGADGEEDGGREADGDGAESPAWALAGESPAFRVAFRLLWHVRAAVRFGYPAEGRQPWWHEYLAQLTLAACRTLKWPRQAQTPQTVAAALIAAGVAGEFLKGEETGTPGCFAYWPSTELHELAARVLPELEPGHDDELRLLLELVSELDRRPGGRAHPPVRQAVRTACDRAVRVMCADAADQRLRKLLRTGTNFIPLHGSVSGEALPPSSNSPGGTPPERPQDALRLAAGYGSVALVGRAGAGKSTILQVLERLYAGAVTGEATDPALPPRMPLSMHAADLATALAAPGAYGEVLARACTAGARLGGAACDRLLMLRGLQLLVDGLDEVPPHKRADVLRWLRTLRTQYRDTPVVLGQRTSAYPTAPAAEPLTAPAITLHPVTTEQARHYAAERLADPNSTPWFTSLFSEGLPPAGRREGEPGEGLVSAGLLELLHTPLFLWMAVESHGSTATPPRTAGELFAVFSTWYLAERHHRDRLDEPPDLRFTPEEKLDLLESVAELLVEHGPMPLKRMEPRLAEVRQDWRAVIDEVVASQFLDVAHGLVRFRHELFQAYCAGRLLARLATHDEAELLRRVLRFEWQEPARMLVGLPDVDRAVLERVWQRAAHADARYGAWLMREAPRVPTELTRSFVERQGHVLASDPAAVRDWDRAAVALTLLRADAAWSVLEEVVSSDDAPAKAVVACLRAMSAAVRGAGATGEDAARRSLRSAVVAVLGRTVPVEVEAAALRAIGQGQLLTLSGYPAERLDAGRPWPVVQEAAAALTALDVELTPDARKARNAACRRRLAAADREAREATRLTDSAALARERGELLSVVAQSHDADSLEVLLDHRFDPGLTELPNWSEMLSTAAGHRRAACPGDPLAGLLLTGAEGDGRRQAMDAFAEGSDREAVAAAHRLLSDGEVPPRQLLDLVTPGSSGQRLLAAASVVESLALADMSLAERLVRGLIARPRPGDPRWLDGLAALIGAVGQQSNVLHVQLLHAASRVVRALDAEHAMRGTWAQTYYVADVGHDVLAALLEHDDEEGHRLAMDHMSGMDFLLTAVGRPERLTLSQEALTRVLAHRPAGWDDAAAAGGEAAASPAEVLRFVQAVAYAGVVEARPFVEDVARSEWAARTLVTYGHSHHGIVELALAAHAVTAVGWFGRLAGEGQRLRAMREARSWLRQLDTRGHHPSLERARLVGLGLLGDWLPILHGLTPADPILHEAATEVVLHWLPVPWDTSPPGDARTTAAWITDRLASGEVTSTEVRDVLTGMATALSRRLGRYIEGPTGHGPTTGGGRGE
ncbi:MULTISPECIES: hypothetical protein [unclassified Streptomyces]|uniref:hypothetical protein n=1 Tax=unclassified Streptomyces TaxID=2593676 RepID=UPI0035DB116E